MTPLGSMHVIVVTVVLCIAAIAVPVISLHLALTPNISSAISSRVAKVTVSLLMSPLEYDYSPIINRRLQLCCHFRGETSCVVVNKLQFAFFLDVQDTYQPLHEFTFAMYNASDIAYNDIVGSAVSISLRAAKCSSALCSAVPVFVSASRVMVYGDLTEDVLLFALSRSDDVVLFHSTFSPCIASVASSLYCCVIHDIFPCLPPTADHLVLSITEVSARLFNNNTLMLLLSRVSHSIIISSSISFDATIALLPQPFLHHVEVVILYESEELSIYSIDMRSLWYHNALLFPTHDASPIVVASSSTASFKLLYGINIATLTHATLINSTTISLLHPPQEQVISSSMRGVLQQTSSGFFQFDASAGWLFVEHMITDPLYCFRGTTVISSPAYTHSISHMSQVMLTLVHAAMHPTVYPWILRMTRLLLPPVDRSDYEWNHALVAAIAAFVAHKTSQPLVQILYCEEVALQRDMSITHDRNLCFEELIVVGSIDMATPYISSPEESSAFREFLYTYLSLPTEEKLMTPNHPLRVTILLRIANRFIYNLNEVVAMIAAAGFTDMTWLYTHIVYLETLTFAEQVQLFRDSDIIISAHASSLQNLMFMHSDSAVIEIFTSPWYEAGFHGTALASGVHYFVLTTTSLDRMDACSFPADCLSPPLLIGRRGCFALRGCNAIVDVNALEVLLWQASQAVRIGKRKLHQHRIRGSCENIIDGVSDCRYRKTYVSPLY